MSAGGEGTAAGGDDAMLFLPLSVRLPRFLPSSTTLCLSLPLSAGTLVEPTAALLIFDERVLSSQRLSTLNALPCSNLSSFWRQKLDCASPHTIRLSRITESAPRAAVSRSLAVCLVRRLPIVRSNRSGLLRVTELQSAQEGW